LNQINQKDQFENEPEFLSSNKMLINYIKINDEIISKFVQNEEDGFKYEGEGKNDINEKELDAKDTSDLKSLN
jgi:hypothetical protein